MYVTVTVWPEPSQGSVEGLTEVPVPPEIDMVIVADGALFTIVQVKVKVVVNAYAVGTPLTTRLSSPARSSRGRSLLGRPFALLPIHTTFASQSPSLMVCP